MCFCHEFGNARQTRVQRSLGEWQMADRGMYLRGGEAEAFVGGVHIVRARARRRMETLFK